MRKTIAMAALAAVLIPATALAAGSPFDGKWKNGERTVTYNVDAGWVTRDDSKGPSYQAPLTGNETPLKNDKNTKVSVQQMNTHTLEEMYMRGNTVTDVTKATVSGDGKSMDFTERNAATHKTTHWRAKKSR